MSEPCWEAPAGLSPAVRGCILLHPPGVTAGNEAEAQMGNPEGSFSSFFIPPSLFFQLGKPDALEFNYTLQLEAQNVRAGKERIVL